MPKKHNPELDLLVVWQADYAMIQSYEARYAKVHGLLDYEKDPTLALISHLWQQRTDALARHLRAGDWLDWFCWENEMGARSHPASVKGKVKERPIRTVNHLLKLIEASRTE